MLTVFMWYGSYALLKYWILMNSTFPLVLIIFMCVFQISTFLFELVRFSGELENYIVAVERVNEYSELQTEVMCINYN